MPSFNQSDAAMLHTSVHRHGRKALAHSLIGTKA